MKSTFIVVEKPADWPQELPEVSVVTPRQYLSDSAIQRLRSGRVFNLCRDYSYQSAGYYVSLLAEARGHRPLPDVATLRRLHGRGPVVSQDLHQLIQTSLAPIHSDEFTLSVYFGRNLAQRHDRLARALFNLFPAPALRAVFVRTREGSWRLRSASVLGAREIPESHAAFVVEAATRYFRRPTPLAPQRHPRYRLAILIDPADPTPPSDESALRRFARAAARLEVAVEFLEPDDLGELAGFDALFIRATTSVENTTFRFANRARAEGIPVIDDPVSILRCSNKVYLAELFERHAIPAPRTRVLYRGADDSVVDELGLPLVIKQPDSAFSKGVVKISTREEFHPTCEQLFEETELLVAQEFLPTAFDWRIGILDGQALYACRYYMARGHWQIYNNSTRQTVSGKSDTLPVEDAPRHVVETALKAARLIGDGLYGVDLKEHGDQALVIEVNDNPSIDHDVEDLVLKDSLYDAVIGSLVRRIESHTAPR